MKNIKLERIIIEYILAQPDQSISEYYLVHDLSNDQYKASEVRSALFELKKSQLVESYNDGDPNFSPTIYRLKDKAFTVFENQTKSKIKSFLAHPLTTGTIGTILGSVLTKLLS